MARRDSTGFMAGPSKTDPLDDMEGGSSPLAQRRPSEDEPTIDQDLESARMLYDSAAYEGALQIYLESLARKPS